MSLGVVSHDACDPPRFSRTIKRPIVLTSLFSPPPDSHHGPITASPFETSIRVPFISSIAVPFISSIRVPFIPSIKILSIPDPTVPVTPGHTPSKEHEFRKHAGNACFGSRDGNPTFRGDIPVLDYYDKDTMALQPTLQARQGYEPVSISGGHCTPSVCPSRYLSGRSIQEHTRDLPNTEFSAFFPQCPVVSGSDRMERLSATDSAMDAAGFPATPVTHVATAVLDPPSLGIEHSTKRVHGLFGFPEPNCAEALNTASGGR
jgi:hypothetical protein